MGAKFFSHDPSGQTGDAGGQIRASEIGLEGLDHQQALVLRALRRAAGAPVSYAELRAAGIELPASVVSELELAGVAIERCWPAGRGTVAVRLDPANDPAERPTPDPAGSPARTDTEPEPAWSSVRRYRASSLQGLVPGILERSSRPISGGSGLERHRGLGRGRAVAPRADPVRETRLRINPRSRVLALTALMAGLAVVSALVLMSVSGGDRGTHVPLAKRPHSRVVVSLGGSRSARAPQSTQPPPPVPVSPALATELEAQGHSLLEAGQYGDAVPVLKRAVLATGETLGACLEPASSTCLTYAYALYDLGRAVRLSGAPQAAVPILERRLQIDNQRPVVGVELRLARQGIA